MGEQRFAGTGRAYQKDVGFVYLDVAVAVAVKQPLVMVVHGDGDILLGAFLPDDILVEILLDFSRPGHIFESHTDFGGPSAVLLDDVVA